MKNTETKHINDGGGAFPAQNLFADNRDTDAVTAQIRESGGMTLRDYFAAKAMQGAIAEGALPRIIKEVSDVPADDMSLDKAVEMTNSLLAKMSYCIADAMITAREAK